MRNKYKNLDLSGDKTFSAHVIITTTKRRGNGKDDPIRIITEVFTFNGLKIAEYDPKNEFKD